MGRSGIRTQADIADPAKPSLNFYGAQAKAESQKGEKYYDIDKLAAVDLLTETFGTSLFIGTEVRGGR
jgi:hypothetical protein